MVCSHWKRKQYRSKSRYNDFTWYHFIHTKLVTSSSHTRLASVINLLLFSRAVLCCLTWNSLGTEVSCVRHTDNARTTCGRCADDVRTTQEWDFIGDLGWRMTYVVCTSSAHHPQAGTSSACNPHMHTSSAHCLPVVRTTPHGQHGPELSFTVTGICYWMEFVARMLNCFISGLCKWFAR